ncbi:hypothetical protein GCM10027290_16500 [Micromonospora sonneratiae]
MSVVCDECGQQNKAESAYCMNPFCCALLRSPARTTLADPDPAPLGGRHRTERAGDAPTGQEAAGGASGPGRPRRATIRLVSAATVAGLLLGAGTVWLITRDPVPPPGLDHAAPQAAVSILPGPDVVTPTVPPTEVVTPTGAPPTSPTRSTPPSATPSPPRTPATPSPTRLPPTTTGGRPATASLSPEAIAICVWPDDRSWVLDLHGKVSNGTLVGATGWHGGSRPASYSLPVSGNTIDGIIPPSYRDELSGESVAWSIRATLSDGRTLTASGTATNPC